MLKFIVPLVGALIFSYSIHAQDAEKCAKKILNFGLAVEMRKIISENDTEYSKQKGGNAEDPNLSDPNILKNSFKFNPNSDEDDYCAFLSKKAAAKWEDERKQKITSLNLVLKDLKSKGKVKGVLFNGLTYNDFQGDELNSNDICKVQTENEDNYLDTRNDLDGQECPGHYDGVRSLFKNADLEQADFQESCKKFVRAYQKETAIGKACSDKEDKEAKIQREAPGEEIAPAEAPKKPKQTIPVKPSPPAPQPGRGRGASRQ